MKPVQVPVKLCCFEVYIAVFTFTTSCISEVSTCTGEATTAAVLAPAPSGMVID